jgi:hypothetical protein
MSMSDATHDEDFNPYDAELRELKIKDAAKKLSDNQKDALLAAVIDPDGSYRIGYVSDERTRNALKRKDILVGRKVTAFGKEVIERVFQNKHGKSVKEVRSLEQAKVNGDKIRRIAKLSKINRRIERLAPILEGVKVYDYFRGQGYGHYDAIEMMKHDAEAGGNREPEEPSLSLTLTQLEQLLLGD